MFVKNHAIIKKNWINFIASMMLFSVSLAHANNFIPDEFKITEHWFSLTKSYEIETKTEKLGTLYRKFMSIFINYEFYDAHNIKQVNAVARFFSMGIHLNLYDEKNNLIGEVKEKIFTYLPTFEIIDRDSVTVLAHAYMNYWGTKFYILDQESQQELAIMWRPFFSFKNDWTIHVTNRTLLEQKHIDRNLLITILAIQGEIEDWQTNKRYLNNIKNKYINKQTLKKELIHLRIKYELDQLPIPSNKILEKISDEIDQEFKIAHPELANQNNEEHLNAFFKYCLNLIESPLQTQARKKAILTLLESRLAKLP